MDEGFEILGLFLNCGIPVFLLLLGLVVGRTVEMAHFRRLDQAEAKLLTIPITDLRTVPATIDAAGATVVMGSVVVGSDYLKTFLAGLRKLVGGEVRSFERLMERARREAVVRLMTEAHRRGAVAVVNLRLEASNVGGMRRGKRIAPMVEMIAYGTAVLPPNAPAGAMDVSVPCPECGYALTGIDDLGCPECGWNRPAGTS
jgi:uncharacterized protein YbjQ (UPF0145 family)